jgi:hypothetical protein
MCVELQNHGPQNSDFVLQDFVVNPRDDVCDRPPDFNNGITENSHVTLPPLPSRPVDPP